MPDDNKDYEILVKMRADLAAAREVLSSLLGLEEEAKKNAAAFNAMESTLETVSGSIDSLGASAGKAKEIIFGFNMEIGRFVAGKIKQLPRSVLDTIKAFGEQEVASIKLAAALKQTGQDVGANLPLLQELATELQRITTIGDETTLEMQNIATAMGINAGQMEEVIKGAVGLAKAFNMDLFTATKAAAAAIQGKTELLTRYIPMLSECGSEEEKLAMVQQAQVTGFQMAKAEADSLLGSIEQLKNIFGDVAEVLGEAFLPYFRTAIATLSAMGNLLNEYPTIVRIVTVAFANLAIVLAFNKIGGLKGVADGFVSVAKSIIGAKNSTVAFSSALKGLAASNAALLAITLALSGLVWWYDKARQARKELTAGLESASAVEVEKIKAETARMRSQGILDANLGKKQIEERIKLLEEEQEILKNKNLKEKMSQAYSSGYGQDAYRKSRDKSIQLDEQIKGKEDQIAALRDQYTLIEGNSSGLELKNAENLIKVKDELAKATEELNAKLRAQSNLEIARSNEMETLQKNLERLKEIDVAEGSENDAVKLKMLGEERLRLTGENFELETEIAKISEKIAANEKQIADEAKRVADERERIAKVEGDANDALRTLETENEILRLKIEDNTEAAKTLKYEQARNKLIKEYKTQFKEATVYKNNAAQLDNDARRNAELVLHLERQQAEIEEASLNRKTAASIDLMQKELQLLKLRASGRKTEAETLAAEIERSKLVNDYVERYQDSIFYKGKAVDLEADALKYANERLQLEKKITDEQAEQEKLKNRLADAESLIYRFLIARAELEGNNTYADQLRDIQAMKKEVQSLINNGWDEQAAKDAVGHVRQTEAEAAKKKQAKSGGANNDGPRTMRESNQDRSHGKPTRPQGPTRPSRGSAGGFSEGELQRQESERNKSAPLSRKRMPSPESIAQQAKVLEERSRGKFPDDSSNLTGDGVKAPASNAQVPNNSQTAKQAAQDAGQNQGGSGENNKVLETLNESVSKILEKISEPSPLESLPETLEGMSEKISTIATGQEAANKVLSDIQRSTNHLALKK